ncbi:MAG TPA: VWA domain-containing protein [Candidatus Binataceae bacterium]|nr:VWA domain-containing protein [Candidatus Binataceae bacterium]
MKLPPPIAHALASIRLAHPRALDLLGLVGVLLLWWLLQVRRPREVLAPLLRALMLALVVMVLAQPQRLSSSEGATPPVAVDLSTSITPSMREYIGALLRDQLKLRDSDPAIAFGRTQVMESIGDVRRQLAGPGCEACAPQHTDLEGAIRKLMALDSGGALVLITDGWENLGDASSTINALLAAHSALDILTPPGAGVLPNVAVSGLTLPHALASSEAFQVGVSLSNMNDHAVAGTLSLLQNGQLVEQRRVTLAAGSTRIDFPVRDAGVGLTSYEARFTPLKASDDLYPEDNSRQAWVGIGAKRKILIFTQNQRESAYVEAVARRLGLEPQVASARQTTFDRSLSGFDAVILNNIAREQLPAATQEALIHYVSAGGALAMVGGDRSFGLGGWQGSALAHIMPVIMKPPQHQERRRALVLIVDKSGSMGRENKLTYAKMAAETALSSLRPDDLIEVIGFDSQPFVVVPLVPVKEARPYFSQMVDRLKARGTTYLMPALQQADRDLAASGAAIKHIVILTDGETGGTAAMYYDLVASMHHQGGVTVSTVAIGREANQTLLDAISRYGGGAAYQTDSPKALPDITLQDTRQHTGELTLVEKRFVPQTANPDPVLKNLAGRRLPPIDGFVSTQLRPGARLDAWTTRAGQREPLIASTTYGAGKTLAVTTDAGGRWATGWIKQNAFGPLWDRFLKWMTPPVVATPKFDVAMGFRDGRVQLHITDYSANPQRELAVVRARVVRPDGSHEEVLLTPAAPGEQQVSFAAPEPGTYYITLRSGLAGKDQPFPPLAYTVSSANFIEVPRVSPNYGLLEHLASATGGRLNPSVAEIKLARPRFESSEGFSRPLLLTVMILLMLEALVRRLTA